MGVDKFGKTDNSACSGAQQVVERVVSGGVSLSQITDIFLQRDGSNAATGDVNLDSHQLVNLGHPVRDTDATTKSYVDGAVANKVSKRGDIVTGDLLLSIGSDHHCELGCRDLNANAGFSLLLGDENLQMKGRLNHPILLETTHGFLVRQGAHDIIRFGM